MRIGNRIPQTYFVTNGVGESDITVHAGSYHLALRDAGIEMANHIMYSSILPGTAREISRPTHDQITHGEVMESITVTATCEYGDTATAGLIWAWLLTPEGDRHGGLVCEYSGSYGQQHAREHLGEMLSELHSNGYEHFRLGPPVLTMRTVNPEKMYGTALAAICFTSYLIPEATA